MHYIVQYSGINKVHVKSSRSLVLFLGILNAKKKVFTFFFSAKHFFIYKNVHDFESATQTTSQCAEKKYQH